MNDQAQTTSQALPPPKGTELLALSLSIDQTNSILRSLDDSNLPHGTVRAISQAIISQAIPQINAIQNELLSAGSEVSGVVSNVRNAVEDVVDVDLSLKAL